MDDRTTVIGFEPEEIHALLEFWRSIRGAEDWPRDPALEAAFEKIKSEDVTQRQARMRARLQSEEPAAE